MIQLAPLPRRLTTFFSEGAHLNAGSDIIRASGHGHFHDKLAQNCTFFVGWTLVSIIFAGISYAAAIGENNKEFGFVSALRLNLVQFYLWAILLPLVFRFSRRFPIELRPLNVRNLLLYFPALISFAGIHQVIHLAVLWSITPRWRQ